MFTILSKAKNWTGSFRVEAIAVLCSVTFLLLFSLSPQLWFGLNELPTAPIVEGLVLPEFLNILLVSALLLAAILLPFDRSGWMSLSAAYLVIFLICYDIHRFQEVTLVFVGAFLLIGLFKRGHLLANQTLQCFVLLLFAQMGIGGLMKLNSYYEHNVFNWLIQPLSQWPLYKYYHYLWFAVPVVEIGTVVCLLFKKTRGFGWLLLVSYHLVMFLLMGPIGVNYGRIHWVSHVLFPIILLITTTDSDFIRPYTKLRGRTAAWVILLLFYALPLLHLVGWYDAVPAFASLDGRHQTGYLSFEKYVLPRLPVNLQKRAVKINGHEKYSLPIEDMAWQDEGVIFYHEERVYRRYKKWLEPYANHPGDVFVILIGKGETKIIQ